MSTNIIIISFDYNLIFEIIKIMPSTSLSHLSTPSQACLIALYNCDTCDVCVGETEREKVREREKERRKVRKIQRSKLGESWIEQNIQYTEVDKMENVAN